MKSVVIFVLGLGVGIGGSFAYHNPRAVGKQVQSLGAKVSEQAEVVQTKQCRQTFLEETQCFQDTSKTAEQCERLMDKACGKRAGTH
jgi:hypothetical protein